MSPVTDGSAAQQATIGALLRAWVALGRVAVRPAGDALALGRRVERGARERVLHAGTRMALDALDVVLASAFVEEVAERVLARAEAAGAPQRIVDRLLADGIAEEVASRVLNGAELERLVEAALESERLRDALIAGLGQPGVESMVARALESPGMERLVKRAVESRLSDETITRIVDETVSRLPEREALWALIDEIAQSPAVTDAITQQGMGFADQVADDVRERSRHADSRLERAALRLLRRRPRDAGPPGPAQQPGA